MHHCHTRADMHHPHAALNLSAKPRRAMKERQQVLRAPLHIRTLVSPCSAWFYEPWFGSKTPFPPCRCLVGRCSIYVREREVGKPNAMMSLTGHSSAVAHPLALTCSFGAFARMFITRADCNHRNCNHTLHCFETCTKMC